MSKDDLYRILVPSEFQVMKDAPLVRQYGIPTQQRNTWLDTLMFTGMRYKELLYLDAHWDRFDAVNRAITLPASFTKTNQDRTIHLIPAFSKSLAAYLREFKSLELPRRESMNKNLKRWWGLIERHEQNPDNYGSWYPTVKTFRKTWESYLLASGYDYMAVCCSQGHSPQISYSYYANLDPRLKSEVDGVKELTKGWGT